MPLSKEEHLEYGDEIDREEDYEVSDEEDEEETIRLIHKVNLYQRVLTMLEKGELN